MTSKCGVINDPLNHTQNIERTWRNVRGGIPRYGRKEVHMIGYLAEFLFKRRFTKEDDIHNFLIQIGRVSPPPIEIIILFSPSFKHLYFFFDFKDRTVFAIMTR